MHLYIVKYKRDWELRRAEKNRTENPVDFCSVSDSDYL